MAPQQLINKSIETITQPQNAGAVGVTTFIAGLSTYFELLTPIIGFFAALLGGALTALLFINSYRKARDERKLSRLQRESEHLEIEIKREKLKDLQDE